MAGVTGSIPIAQPWFSTPFFEQALSRSDFTNSQIVQIKKFAQQGFLIFDPEIDDIDALAADVRDNVPYEIRDGKPFGRVLNFWTHNGSIRRLATLPTVLKTLNLIYQRAAIPFQTLTYPVGTQQPTHSDAIHFHSIPERWMCAVWIALEDVDEFNGPLHYYQSSHRLPILHMHDLGLSPQDYWNYPDDWSNAGRFYPMYEQIVREMLEVCEFERIELPLKKGQAVMWDANLYHGGSPIRDLSRTRLSQVTHYYFEGCSYYTPFLSDLPLGKVVWRNFESIIDGAPVRHMYNGRPVVAPGFDGRPQMLELFEGGHNAALAKGHAARSQLPQAIADRDAAQLSQAIADRDVARAQLSQAIADRDAVLASTSWRLSAPARWVKTKILQRLVRADSSAKASAVST